ncbi:MAG: DUF1697 domain-containing protein [Gemmatimonadota bacterium]|nr:DUF1697 domain-containing protein [Gemmatimonadota bacterium]
MPVFVALLRAVNVGGTGKLVMSELRDLCGELGFGDVRTYIQSGNLVLTADLDIAGVKGLLQDALEQRMGKPVGVLVRTPAEIASVLERNPYPDAPPNRVLVMFLDEAPAPGLLDGVETPGGEEVAASGREIYVYFPNGQGRSRLKMPMAGVGTARNLNTVRKLRDMSLAIP